jgi:hypothetical protein
MRICHILLLIIISGALLVATRYYHVHACLFAPDELGAMNPGRYLVEQDSRERERDDLRFQS